MMGMPLLILPSSIAIGDLIAFANEKAETREGRKDRYTFAGASYFKRMQELGLYTIDKDEINNRVKKVNLDNIFEQKLVQYRVEKAIKNSNRFLVVFIIFLVKYFFIL